MPIKQKSSQRTKMQAMSLRNLPGKPRDPLPTGVQHAVSPWTWLGLPSETHLGKVVVITTEHTCEQTILAHALALQENMPGTSRGSSGGQLWREGSTVTSGPQRATVTMHLTCSHLSCSGKDGKPPCRLISRALWPHHPGPGSQTPAAVDLK